MMEIFTGRSMKSDETSTCHVQRDLLRLRNFGKRVGAVAIFCQASTTLQQ